MVLTCNFLKKISNIFARPVYSGLFLFCTFISSNRIEANYYPTIINIEVIGLDKTKRYIIDREILHPLNSQIDSTLADLDRNRIFNLGLFDNVAWRLVPLESGDANLQFIMIESINRTPPLIFPSYEEDKGWSLTGLLIVNNFQGKNRTFKIEGSTGAQDRIELLFDDPWIFGDHISLSFYSEYNTYEHLFLNSFVNVKKLKLSAGRWYGEKIKLRFSPALLKKIFTSSEDTLIYSYLIPELEFKIDTRDIFWNPEKGIRVIQLVKPMLGENQFYIWNQSFSFYKSINKNMTLGLNAVLQHKFGYKNDVWISYFGNSFNIRGWDLPGKKSVLDNYRFGHEYIHSSIEFRRLILSKSRPKFGLSKGLCLVAFVDGGIIGRTWREINKDTFIGGAGFGIRIPIPVIQSIRIDVGWGYKDENFNKNYAFHLAIGQKF